MAADIMQLCNQLVYNGTLRCGSQRVAQACLDLPGLARLSAAAPPVQPWILQALSPAARVLFLDTDGVTQCEDRTENDAVFNTGEAVLVRQLVGALKAAGLPAAHLGIVSTYRAQVSLIKALIQGTTSTTCGAAVCATAAAAAGNLGQAQCEQQQEQEEGSEGGAGPEVEVLTIDKYQGRDKECIILSCVRSNAVQCTGRLLTDWQRINVALTRAKHKLLMLGSSRTLSNVPLLAAMLRLLNQQGCVLRLPEDVLAQLGQPAGHR